MSLGEIIAIAVIVLVVGGAVAYIVKAKKSGVKCIGCPNGCSGCSCKKSGGCQGCSKCPEEDEQEL